MSVTSDVGTMKLAFPFWLSMIVVGGDRTMSRRL